MRQRFNRQPDLQITPIEKIVLPLKSRDELPPILATLQWIWMHPTLKAQILALLEVRVLGEKKATGRTGMDLWQILVLGVVRLGLDADWDRMEHLANYDLLLRQMLGVCQGFVKIASKVLRVKGIEDFAGQTSRFLPVWAACPV